MEHPSSGRRVTSQSRLPVQTSTMARGSRAAKKAQSPAHKMDGDAIELTDSDIKASPAGECMYISKTCSCFRFANRDGRFTCCKGSGGARNSEVLLLSWAGSISTWHAIPFLYQRLLFDCFGFGVMQPRAHYPVVANSGQQSSTVYNSAVVSCKAFLRTR